MEINRKIEYGLTYSNAKEAYEYRVGALLYAPGIYTGLAEKLLAGEFAGLGSFAFCLEDSILDDALEQAEAELGKTMRELHRRTQELAIRKMDLPLLFIRIRTPMHLKELYEKLAEASDLLTGFILPKFDLSNAADYSDLIKQINASRQDPVFIMPILESGAIAYKETRQNTLIKLRWLTDQIADYVLNIRVGGNDLSNTFGLRRSVNQTIYDIGVINEILVDIVNIFGRDYVVSGPVWEYFDTGESEAWKEGLQRELAMDRLNGFIGKTAIHPSQLPVITKSMKVSYEDYCEALQIVNWSSTKLAVSKSATGQRMSEVKVHGRWARRILRLAEIYGVLEKGVS